jgi:hypothetical protein
VNNEGVKININFEFIEIMDESDPYPTLLGIDWAFENNAVLNLKKMHISFETDTLCVVVPLDPYEGDCYNETIYEDAQRSGIENILKVMGSREDYINPSVDGKLSWRSVKYYDMDFEDALDRWHNTIYEVSTRRFIHISIEENMEDVGSYRYDGSDPGDILIAWI